MNDKKYDPAKARETMRQNDEDFKEIHEDGTIGLMADLPITGLEGNTEDMEVSTDRIKDGRMVSGHDGDVC